jgi:hypothetical protein
MKLFWNGGVFRSAPPGRDGIMLSVSPGSAALAGLFSTGLSGTSEHFVGEVNGWEDFQADGWSFMRCSWGRPGGGDTKAAVL